jgi:O-antigen ligase
VAGYPDSVPPLAPLLPLDPLPALLLGCLVWLSLLLRVTLRGLPPLARPRAWQLLLLFPSLAALSFLTSANRGATLVQTLLYASYAAAAWLTADLVRRKGSWWVIGALLAGALLAAGLGLREHAEHVRDHMMGMRVSARFTNPNLFAAYLVPSLLLGLGLAPRRPEPFKPSTWLLVLTLLTGSLAGALMVTGSRGGLSELGVGLVLLALLTALRKDVKDRETRVRMLVLGAVLGLALLLFSTSLRSRLEGTTGGNLPPELCPNAQEGASGNSDRFRILTWTGSVNMGMARPLTGWGAGTFDTAFAPHEIAGFTRHAHSGYLQLFAEEGFPALLFWIGLLLAAAAGLWRQSRSPEASWAPGVAAALAAASVHNAVDSTLPVPAVALLVWTLLGISLSAAGDGQEAPEVAVELPEAAPPADRSPGAGDARKPRSGKRRAAGGAVETRGSLPGRADARRPSLVLLAAAGLAITGLHALGRLDLNQGRAAVGEDPPQAQDALQAAQLLLPWDHQVADAQRYLFSRLQRPEQAAEAARRAIRLAPLRPPGYFLLGNVYRRQGNLPLALQAYEAGLRRAPNEVELLYARAEVLEQQHRDAEALETYRRIAQVEESPVGQVRALAEVLDYRFARARMALARDAERTGDRDGALAQEKLAACLLGERRHLHDGNPTSYIALGGWDPDTERDLRTQEQHLWTQVAEGYRSRGNARLAGLSAAEAIEVDRSRDRLEQIITGTRSQDGSP